MSNSLKIRVKKYSLFIAILLLAVRFVTVTDAQLILSYSPPSHVTIRMYRLVSPEESPLAGEVYVPTHVCNTFSIVYGCTAFVGNVVFPYPYENDNPVSIPIETDYLLDVVSQEMGILSSHGLARHAQAIVARTYAYHRQHFDTYTGTPVMNNSTASQVFIPYRWEKWGNSSYFSPNATNPCHWWHTNFLSQQREICLAVNASKNYITGINNIYDVPSTPIFGNNSPAFTKYFQDTYLETLTEPSPVPGTNPPRSTYPYLVGVSDAISSHPQVPNVGHRHGMSQNGASRWAYGNLGWQGNLDKWSVTWTSTEQILTHYYTNITIRNQYGVPVIQDKRWNPLKFDWGTANSNPPKMQHGSAYPVTVVLQNTSTEDWDCFTRSQVRSLQYYWTRNNMETVGYSQISLCGIPRGASTKPISFPIENIPNWGNGTYGLNFDISTVNGTTRFNYPYTVLVCVGNDPCGDVFVPLVTK